MFWVLLESVFNTKKTPFPAPAYLKGESLAEDTGELLLQHAPLPSTADLFVICGKLFACLWSMCMCWGGG